MNRPLLQQTMNLFKSNLIRNSFWGIAANGAQSILVSLFFVMVARKYDTRQFAFFLIANTIYQFLAAFSALGLGQWFTREVVEIEDKKELVSRFLKIQLYSGLFFYACNIIVAFTLYQNELLRYLIVLLGINIIFDNIIYAIKALNVAEYRQNKTFIILVIDSVLKFLIGCALFVYPLSIITLAVLLLVVRFITLNFFLGFGAGYAVSIRSLCTSPLSGKAIRAIVFANWPFIIIGSVSIAYWRISNIIISKTLSLADVAHFEISYRVLAIAQILPLIVSMTVFPSLVRIYGTGNKQDFKEYYNKVFVYYLLFGVFAYSFVYSFADALIPWAFGSNYNGTGVYTKEMFLTMLIFPTALLQANVLVAMKMERADMWFNVVSLVLNTLFCLAGFMIAKTLTTVNLAIFFSFLVFHICQDVLLLRKGMVSLWHVARFYIVTALMAGIYVLLSYQMPGIWVFGIYWVLVGAGFLISKIQFGKKLQMIEQ
jgi:Membrane protein involved in the export of O-antigen and teichoic acid